MKHSRRLLMLHYILVGMKSYYTLLEEEVIDWKHLSQSVHRRWRPRKFSLWVVQRIMGVGVTGLRVRAILCWWMCGRCNSYLKHLFYSMYNQPEMLEIDSMNQLMCCKICHKAKERGSFIMDTSRLSLSISLSFLLLKKHLNHKNKTACKYTLTIHFIRKTYIYAVV